MVRELKRTIVKGMIVTGLCIVLLAIISISAFNIDSIAIANSSTSSNTMDINYQVVIPGENDNKPVSNMTVTLLIMGFDNNTNSNRVLGKVDVPNNPLTSSNSITNGGAAYVFKNLPVLPDDELYLVKTERNGRTWEEYGETWSSGYVKTTNSFDDKHTFPIPADISDGTLYGFVILDDPNHSTYDNRKSGVKVILYSCLPYSESNGIVNTGVVDIPNNLQVTMGGDQVGMYRFEGLKPGFYNVTIEKDGLVGHKVINFTGDESNNNWFDNNMVLLRPSPTPQANTPTPQPTTTPTATIVITSTANSTPINTPQETLVPMQSPVSSTPVPAPGFTFSTIAIIGCILIVVNLLPEFGLQKK